MDEILVEVSEARARELFPNWTIWFGGESQKTSRCWWDEIEGRFHQFPASHSRYWVSQTAHEQGPLKMNDLIEVCNYDHT